MVFLVVTSASSATDSEDIASEIDQEVHHPGQTAFLRAQGGAAQPEGVLRVLATRLTEVETMEGAEMKRIIDGFEAQQQPPAAELGTVEPGLSPPRPAGGSGGPRYTGSVPIPSGRARARGRRWAPRGGERGPCGNHRKQARLDPEVTETERAARGSRSYPAPPPAVPPGPGEPRPRLAFVGAGRAGGALAAALAAVGYPVVAISGRDPERASALAERVGARPAPTALAAIRSADLTFLTVPDAAVTPVAAGVAASGAALRGRGVVHCSASLGIEELAALPSRGRHDRLPASPPGPGRGRVRAPPPGGADADRRRCLAGGAAPSHRA